MTGGNEPEWKTLICAAFPSLEGNLFFVTVVPKAAPDERGSHNAVMVFNTALPQAQQEQVKAFIGRLHSGIGDVQFVFQQAALNDISFLRLLKIMQPVTLADLNAAARRRNFVPEGRVIENLLDRLRKDGLVHWNKQTARYCLTEKALDIVPHGKYRTSSDIERALALGRRRW